MTTPDAIVNISPMEEGVIVTVVGLLVIFASLIVLFVIFQYVLPWSLETLHRIRSGDHLSYTSTKPTGEASSGEEMAAIAAAVYLFIAQTHDEENAILTINKARKDYSPWSSKIYMTHHVPPKQR